MSESIYQDNYADAIRDYESYGYRRLGNTQPERVEYEGRVWSREATFAKDIKGWDRFVLFIRTLFEKIAVALKFKSLSGDKLKVLKDKWELAWNGNAEFKVYSDVLLKMQAKVFDLIYPVNPAALPQESAVRATERNKTFSNDSPIEIIPMLNSFAVRISQELEGAEDLFENKLNELNIPFVQQDRPNGLKQFVIDNNNMSQFLSALGDFQALIAQDAQAQELYASLGAVNITHHSATQEGRPRVDNAIALTLAHLDPQLHRALSAPNITMTSTPENQLGLPLVTFDEFGHLTIKLPKPGEALQKRMEDVLFLDCKLKPDTINCVEYEYELKIKRDNVEKFLEQLGLTHIPAEMHPDYADGQRTYIDYLVNTGVIHRYSPEHLESHLETLNLALSEIIPGNQRLVELADGEFGFEAIKPYTAIHPNGGLSIRFPNLNDNTASSFAERLKRYLEAIDTLHVIDFTLHPIDFNIAGQDYNREMRIKEDSLRQFVSLLGLRQGANDNNFFNRLVPCEASQRYQPSYARPLGFFNRSGFDPLKTIAMSLLSHTLPEDDLPELEVKINPFNGLDIEVPQQLQALLVEIAPGTSLNFGQYLAHIYCLKGQQLPDGTYRLSVPRDAIKSFLERDLKLRAIPAVYREEGQVSFYREFVTKYGDRLGLQNQPYGTIKGWSMRNPTVNLPENIPNLSIDQIVSQARLVLQGHPRVNRYCQVIEETLNRRGELGQEQQQLLIKYLSLMVLPPMASLGITRDRQRAALATIGETATNCLPGRFTKIQVEFNSMLNPESRDPLKTDILQRIEEFKMGVLATVLRTRGRGDGLMDVHYVASAQVAWGQELGLDVEAGRRDSYQNPHNVTDAQKQEFMRACENGLVDYLFNQLSEARVENEGTPTDELLYGTLYQERLNNILLAEGYSEDDIIEYDDDLIPVGGVLLELMPIEEGEFRLTREALMKILIDMDILNG